MVAVNSRSIGPRRAQLWLGFVGGLCLLALGCSPRIQDIGPIVGTPSLGQSQFATADGRSLPYRQWSVANGPPRAIVLALHGFNDYSNAFEAPARFWAERGVATYAYDQRGFGATSDRGLWAGGRQLTADLHAFSAAIRDRHPRVPLYLLGDSMGGAVILSAEAEARRNGADGLQADGSILVAPAVWGRATMPALYRAVLWLGAHLTPWNEVTASGLNIVPSDNIEMLRALSRDPLVIKQTRIDAVYGLVGLMDDALQAADAISTPTLVLYGAKDEVVPKAPTVRMLEAMNGNKRIMIYPNGYHMLLRDLQAEAVWLDVLAWIGDRSAPLPSGVEIKEAREILARRP